ncbi:uncharacterized protein LOC113473917 isoform X2 [Diaphorina citri]|uniref:Uncharacterized protein LOC113473917 isoform X2 n=1 Tax=Diaphorina citri TaxID=121845 RepID=A0A3Q0JLK2_DIACI|nr:uncharacterized protein LOC113473917 isoform X2 [Diaphorina citri]
MRLPFEGLLMPALSTQSTVIDKKGSETITAALPCPFNDTPEYETDNEIIRVKKDIRSLKENAKL